jgi:hypothetical protein
MNQEQPRQMNQHISQQRSKPVPQKNYGVRLGAGCLFFWALGAFFAVIGSMADGNAGGALGATFLTALFAGTAVYWLRWQKKNETGRRSSFDDKIILDLAANNGGNVTLAQVSYLTSLSVEQAEATLSRLCAQGLARVEMTEDGTIVYVFAGLGPLRLD